MWRDRWNEFTDPPDARDRSREREFLSEHFRYGATIHRHTADVIYAALQDERNSAKRHTLALRLFAEFANALESLAAWGWTLQRRREFRLFLDAFLSYPPGAVKEFYSDVLGRPDASIVELLDLPPRSEMIRLACDLVQESTARQVGEYLDAGTERIRQAAEQFMLDDQVILSYYNRAKHGTSMVRLKEHTQDELDFQVIAPERREEKIGEGFWYNIALFQAGDEMIGRAYRNVEAVTHWIMFMATIAWILYRSGYLYENPPPPP